MYAKGMSTRDITAALEEMYGMEVSAQTITTITNKVMPLVEEWQARPLEALYPIVYLDALYFRTQGRKSGGVHRIGRDFGRA